MPCLKFMMLFFLKTVTTFSLPGFSLIILLAVVFFYLLIISVLHFYDNSFFYTASIILEEKDQLEASCSVVKNLKGRSATNLKKW